MLRMGMLNSRLGTPSRLTWISQASVPLLPGRTSIWCLNSSALATSRACLNSSGWKFGPRPSVGPSPSLNVSSSLAPAWAAKVPSMAMAISGCTLYAAAIAPCPPTSSCTDATATTSQACWRVASSSRQTVIAATDTRLSNDFPASRSPFSSIAGASKVITSPTRTSAVTSSCGSPTSIHSSSRVGYSVRLRAMCGGAAPKTPGSGRCPWTSTGWLSSTRASMPPSMPARMKPARISATIKPISSIWAHSMTLRRGSGPLPVLVAIRLPRPSTSKWSARPAHAARIASQAAPS